MSEDDIVKIVVYFGKGNMINNTITYRPTFYTENKDPDLIDLLSLFTKNQRPEIFNVLSNLKCQHCEKIDPSDTDTMIEILGETHGIRL